ncbi:MAG: Calx-beta domain-containing protein [Pirellulales bacterium]
MSRSSFRKRTPFLGAGRSGHPRFRVLAAEFLEDRRMLHLLTTGSGDGSLTVTVDGFGSFGSAVGFPQNTPTIYDPIGPIGPASTTFQSGVAFRLGNVGGRQFLTSGDILGSGGLSDPLTSGSSTDATSTFTFGGLSFELAQNVSPLLNASSVQTGSVLTQRYVIRNVGSSQVDFEIVRYIDGDLLFDGSLVDGGGRLFPAGREFLFETDAGGSGATDTTFLGIDANGGTIPTIGRFEVDSFSGLGSRINDGSPLDNLITGDFNGDGFVDVGQEYDVTLALRNLFTVAAGESVIFATRTVFGSGTPEDLPFDPLVEFGAEVMQLEGDGGLTPFVFTLNLTEANTSVVVVYTTVDGTAVSPFDYEAQSGTLSFQAGGPSTQLITVNVVGDLEVEANETFLVRLTNVSGGGIPDSEAVGTILNDDVELSIGDVSIVEGDVGTKDAVFTVAAVGAINRTVTLGYTTVNDSAAAGSDFLARGGVVTLPSGASSARIVVPIVGDRRNEANERFVVLLTGAQHARIVDNLGHGTIIDNDPLPNFYVSDVQVTTTSPGVLAAVFTVALDAASGREVVVEFATADGDATADLPNPDYEPKSGILTFAPGVTTRTVSVPVLTGGTYVPNKKFFLNLRNPLHAFMSDPQGAATIVFGDEPAGEFIIDDGDLGYSRSGGGWTNVTNTLAYHLDYDYHAAGNGSAFATWAFADKDPGSYQVFARWSWFSNRATNAPYTILDGATPLDTVLVNQRLAPTGDWSNGITWQSLGTYQIATGNLAVRLTNNANGFVIADAIRIVSGGIAPQEPEMDVAGFDKSIRTPDHEPELEDATDFGPVPALSDSMIHRFTISNHGNADLHLTGNPRVTLGGVHAADFTVITQPAAAVMPLRSTTFELMFHPSGAGLRTAVISIANDDDSEHPYTFTVQGTGIAAGVVPYAQNAALPPDVNADGRVSAVDVLIVVNNLIVQNMATSGPPPAAAPLAATPPPPAAPSSATRSAAAPPPAAPLVATGGEGTVSTYYMDVNADGRISAVDVLIVVNYLLSSRAAAPSASRETETLSGGSQPLAAAAVDEAMTLFDDLPAETAADPPRVEMGPASKAAAGHGSAVPRLLEPAAVPSLLVWDESEEAEEFDPILLALGD